MNMQERLEEREYIDLYNKGYGLFQSSPELAELLIHANTNDPRMEPLKAGISQGKEHEKEKANLPNWLKMDRFKNNERDIDRDIEPEKD